jgi:hypothetical protein
VVVYLVEFYASAVGITDGVESVAVRKAVGVTVGEALPLALLQIAFPVHQRRHSACGQNEKLANTSLWLFPMHAVHTCGRRGWLRVVFHLGIGAF